MDMSLVSPASPGMPAPVWFVQFFKILGFALHSVPMNLWYAGLLIALVVHLRGGEHGRRFGARLLKQMPIIIALGINLGIVPLLFVQLAYYKFFYPATILMAWHWLGIIALLIPAYYGVYVYALALREEEDNARRAASRTPGNKTSARPVGEGQGARASGMATIFRCLAAWKQPIGWLAALLFVTIGFLFVNGMSLLDHVERWPELWRQHQIAGAATGTALNVGDATLWPRLLLMFGLAICTTAAWCLIDSEWFAAGESDAYRAWTWQFAMKLYTVGMIWTATAGTWYVFGSWSPDLRATMFRFPFLMLTALTAVAAGLPWLLIMKAPRNKVIAGAVGAAQFGVLGINAISRQVVQNVNLKPYLDVMAQPTDVQWGPLVMFLVVFVVGLGVIAWMLVQAIAAVRWPNP